MITITQLADSMNECAGCGRPFGAYSVLIRNDVRGDETRITLCYGCLSGLRHTTESFVSQSFFYEETALIGNKTWDILPNCRGESIPITDIGTSREEKSMSKEEALKSQEERDLRLYVRQVTIDTIEQIKRGVLAKLDKNDEGKTP